MNSRFLLIVTICASIALNATDISGLAFVPWQTDDLPQANLALNERGFSLSFHKKEGSRNYALAIGNVPANTVVPAQYKISFQMKGGALNKNTLMDLSLAVAAPNSGEWITKYSDSVSCDCKTWKTIIMGLDSHFNLSDALWDVKQIKFHLRGGQNPNGFTSAEVRNVRIVPASELGPEGLEYQVRMPPSLKERLHSDAPPLVRVHFDLDNEDRGAFIPQDPNGNGLREKNFHDGFRGFLLRGVDGCHQGQGCEFLSPDDTRFFQLVDDPALADVIVYSRAMAAPDIPHVHPNKPMLVFGNVADADVREALPVTVTYLSPNDYAKRQRVRPVISHPLLDGDVISDAAFGKYAEITVKDGARRLLDFADGSPCVVEGDHVLYAATGIGAQLLPDSFFYDRFLLKAILYLAGKPEAFPALDALKHQLQAREAEAEQQCIAEILQEAGLKDSRDNWQMGMSKNNFGRFGYQPTGQLLCAALRKDMAIENGAVAFRMDFTEQPVPDEPPSIIMEDVSWTGRRFRICNQGNRLQMQISLLLPFVRYAQTPRQLFLALEGTVHVAVIEDGKGRRNVRLASSPLLYNKARDGALKRPWLLLYGEEDEAVPLQVVFSRNPLQLQARFSDDGLEGIDITFAQDDAEILCGWPWGTAPQATRTWPQKLPQVVVRKLDTQAKLALNYPDGCDEIFRIAPDGRHIQILQRTRNRHIANDWDVPPFPHALMPPLMAFALKERIVASNDRKYALVAIKDSLTDMETPTRFGPSLMALGRSTLSYFLPLPNTQADIVTGGFASTDDPWIQEANAAIKNGVRWSWGGGAPFELLSFDSPMGNRGGENISPFTWQYGLSTALQGYFLLDDEAKAALRRRVSARFTEPLDQYQYKYMARHRMEPFTGLAYPVLFRSIFRLGVNAPPDEGTQCNYADCNEASVLMTWIAELLADRFGMTSLVKANWPFLKYAASHQKVMDDWAYHAASCREDGAGAWIDMLNGEYSGMVCHARLTAIVGDTKEERDALYRAAKRMVPTLARLRFHHWLGEPDDPKSPQRLHSVILGFGDDGCKTYPIPIPINGNSTQAMDLFDFSEGAPGSLFRLYDAWALPEIHHYLRNFALPAMAKPEGFLGAERVLQVLGYFTAPYMEWEAWSNQSIESNRRRWHKDWVGIAAGYPLALLLHRKFNAPLLSVCQQVKIEDLRFDVASRELNLTVTATEKSIMEIPTPQQLIVNGMPVAINASPSIRLPLQPGFNRITAAYP